MRLLALLAAGLFAGVVTAEDKKDEKKVKDGEAILGTWKVDKIDGGGPEPIPVDLFTKVRLTFSKDGKLSVIGPDAKEQSQEYKLDPAAKPKSIDIITDGQTVPGLYEFDGDVLKLCTALGKPSDKKFTRPTEFKADGKGVVVMTLKRVTDEKKEEKKDK